MENQAEHSVIYRKTKEGRNEFNARVMSPAKAFRVSLAQVAEKLFGLALSVSMVEQTDLSQAELQTALGDDDLLLLMDGTGGTQAAVKLDFQLLAALIEVQTLGKVRDASASPRPYTRTDAAMVQPMVDGILAGLDRELSGAYETYEARGFRFGVMMEDARTLSLMLTEQCYEQFRLTVDIAEGKQTGVITVILPKRPEVTQTDEAEQPTPGKRGVSLKQQALGAPAVMDTMVARLSLPLNQICKLEPGAILPLEVGCLEKARLVTAGGHEVGHVHLGQMNGLRAVRLVASDEDVTASPSGGTPLDPAGEVNVAPPPVPDPVPPPEEEANPSNLLASAMASTGQ